MHHHNWKKEVLTIPNLLSIFRLLLIPVYTKLYLEASSDLDYYLAGTALGISCLTDFADGKIARDYHMVSNVGKLLDPLADKLTQLIMILSLLRKYTLLFPVLLLFLAKEIVQCVALVLFAQRGKVLDGALFAGKLCTAVLFISMILLVLFPRLSKSTGQTLICIDAILLLYSFCSYIQAYWGNNPKLKDISLE